MQKPLMAEGNYTPMEDHGGRGGSVGVSMNEVPDIRNKRGLTGAEAEQRLLTFGPNEIKEVKKSVLLQLMGIFWGDGFSNPISWLCGLKIGPIPKPIPAMMWVAIIVSAAIGDWTDFGIILFLHVVNGGISFYENQKAGDAVAALRAALAPRCNVKRDGVFNKIDAKNLVPGDLILLKIGDVVPADCMLAEEHGASVDVDQSGLTGESLPVTKFPGDTAYSGTVVKRGEMEAIVTGTGENTEFGKTAKLIQSVKNEGHFQAVLFSIAKVIIIFALVLVLVLLIHGFASEAPPGQSRSDYNGSIIQQCLVLLVASIPIAMPVVCTATMAVGSRRLAKANAICTRISAIEELAGMTVLCSDKTGTLTKNELTLYDPWCVTGISAEQLIFYATLASKDVDPDAIDLAIRRNCKNLAEAAKYAQTQFIPFDPIIKRTEASIRAPDNATFKVSKGAPQVILKLCDNKEIIGPDVERVITEFANRGLRSLGVCRTDDEGKWVFLGIISLFDPPRDDTKTVIESALELGSEVKMITGDHLLIAKETCRQLGMGSNILGHHALDRTEAELLDLVEEVDGFAEVFPDQKFKIVALFQQRGHITGMTGDGVNDAPALKKADIGFAVHGATPAAQGAASVVLLTPGLSVIIEAIIRSRKIFQRMKNYCIYRVNLSMMLLGFFFVSQLAFGLRLPAVVIVLMALLNDGTIMTIAYDKVQPSKKPESWRVFEVCTVAVVLGLVSVGAILFLYVMVSSGSIAISFPGNEISHKGHYKTVVFLALSLMAELSVFSARTDHAFFTRRPGYALLTALITEMAVSTFLSVYWPSWLDVATAKPVLCTGPISDNLCFCNTALQTAFTNNNPTDCVQVSNLKAYDYPMQPCGWEAAAITWIFAVIVLVIQENAKSIAYYFLQKEDDEAKKELEAQQKAARKKLASLTVGPKPPGAH